MGDGPGESINDRPHRLQFKARVFKARRDRGGGHRKVSGLGPDPRHRPGDAKRMVKAFGEQAFDIIEAEPDRLREVDGISPLRASRMVAGWAEQKAVREIMIFLRPRRRHGSGGSHLQDLRS